MQKNCFLPILLLILPLHNASAETAEEKGLAIAVEADKRDTGWVDQTADLEMILTNKHGERVVNLPMKICPLRKWKNIRINGYVTR